MEKVQFFTVLYNKFIERGMDERYASRQIEQIKTNLTQDDENEILDMESPDDVNDIADGYYSIYKRRMANQIARRKAQQELAKRQQQSMQNEAANKPYQPDLIITRAPEESKNNENNTDVKINPEISVRTDISADAPVQMVKSEPQKENQKQINTGFENNNFNSSPEIKNLSAKDKSEKISKTGKTVFWVSFILTLPITAAIITAIFGIFVSVTAILAALIIVCVAALIAGVIGGSAASLVGIIYGITQLFTTPQIGAYEIGIGVIIAGAVMFASILLYNFAIRLLPFIIKKIVVLFGICIRKLKQLFIYAKGECYKL